jgi:hypothetical protein
MRPTLSALLPGLLLGLAATAAQASGGFYEINEACRSVGCFPGDNPATETVEITSAATTAGIHSFRLSGRLVNFNGATPTIRISTDSVTLDLQGHQIFCESGVGCSQEGGSGVLVEANRKATIRNGVITQFHSGIRGESGAVVTVESMQLTNMSNDGVRLQYGVIRDSRFDSNASGILSFAGQSLLIENNIFVDARPVSVTARQLPLLGVLATSACRGNVIAANNRSTNLNLGSCTEIGSNLCGSARCGLN